MATKTATKSLEQLIEALEQRVEALERQIKDLTGAKPRQPGRVDWRNTIGMFADDPVYDEIVKAGARIRVAGRRASKRARS